MSIPDETIRSSSTLFLFGPKGTGKRMLVSAVATETGAILYNISPRVIGLSPNPAKTLGTVFKTAKMTAPSIIYMADAESVFAKKMGKDDPFDARKLKKDFLKCLKSLSPSDHVVVIGCSHKPWESDPKAIQTSYERIIAVPKPDYGSRHTLWSHEIQSRGAKMSSELSIATLSRLSEGCTAGDVCSPSPWDIDSSSLYRFCTFATKF